MATGWSDIVVESRLLATGEMTVTADAIRICAQNNPSATFTATDMCGNYSTTATFTVEDTTAPVITAGAADETIECGGNYSYDIQVEEIIQVEQEIEVLEGDSIITETILVAILVRNHHGDRRRRVCSMVGEAEEEQPVTLTLAATSCTGAPSQPTPR